jgi:glycosyltransferase involved in cell wall biosynthesis
MRILIGPGMVPPKYGGIFAGGASYVGWNIARELALQENDVFMYTLHDFPKENIENIHILERRKYIVVPKALFKAAKEIKWAKELLSKYYRKKLLNLSLKFCIRYVYWLDSIDNILPDIVHIHGNGLYNFAFILATLKRKYPMVITNHGLANKSDYNNSDFPFQQVERDIFTFLKTNDVNITTVSSTSAEKIVKKYNYPLKKIAVIPNGVEKKFFLPSISNKYKLREKLGLPLNKIIILTVGTLSKRKNQSLVIETLVHLEHNYNYIIVGDGGEENNLKEKVKKLHLNGRVIFLGKVMGQKLIDLYHASDIFVLTSKSEGLPLVFLEAMAAGLPIVTMRGLAGVSDVDFNNNIIKCNSYNALELASKIKKVTIDNNIRKNISEIAKKHFNWADVSKKYLSLYKEIIENK